MNNTPNVEQIFTDLNHDFIKLYNAANSDNHDIENINDSPYSSDDNYCKYYTPDELIKTIGQQNKLSMFCVNSRSINSNWDALNELIYNMSSEHFHFDIIALKEIGTIKRFYSVYGVYYVLLHFIQSSVITKCGFIPEKRS